MADDSKKMIAMGRALGKGFDVRSSDNKEAVQFLPLFVVEVPVAKRGGIVNLSFAAGPVRAVKVDRPESNSRRVQYVMVVVIDAFSSPLCSNLGNHVTEEELIDLVLFVAA